MATSEMQIAASDGSISYPTVSTRGAGLALKPRVSQSARDPSEYAIAHPLLSDRKQTHAARVGAKKTAEINGIPTGGTLAQVQSGIE